MTRIATDHERKVIDGHHLRNWIKSKDYRAKRDLYFSVLVTIGAATTNRQGEPDPRILSELLAITIEGDATFRGWVRKRCRNSARLKTAEGWRDVALCAAVLVVEQFQRHPPDTTSGDVIDEFAPTREELADRVHDHHCACATKGDRGG